MKDIWQDATPWIYAVLIVTVILLMMAVAV
jgi:hypothetical protein